jgi:hypothetical protein
MTTTEHAHPTPLECADWLRGRVESRLAMFDLLCGGGHMSDAARRREERIAAVVLAHFSAADRLPTFRVQAFPDARPPDGPEATLLLTVGATSERLLIANADVLVEDLARRRFVFDAIEHRAMTLIRRATL